MDRSHTAHSEGPSAFAKPGEQHSAAAELELRNVSKRYDGQREPAIGDLSLTVPAGEVCVLVGPSGSGKTTAMRLINRMISITSGDILLGGHSVLERDARGLRREIGYVIQQTGLFPHQTVGENIATVPGLLGWPKQRVATRVHELIELIGLDPEMTGRYPAQLSGGQRQRVGVARALAADPPLMLMDEPFGAIDPINRARLQDEFLGLQRMVKKTIVFVTHDIDEAIKMGDRIAILRDGGQLAQYDTPREILIHPADDFVAEFVGADRGIKRLSLTKVGELKLTAPEDGAVPGDARVPAEASVKDALSVILTAGGETVSVLDADGGLLGTLTLGAIERMLAEETAQAAHEAAAGVNHGAGGDGGSSADAAAAHAPEAAA